MTRPRLLCNIVGLLRLSGSEAGSLPNSGSHSRNDWVERADILTIIVNHFPVGERQFGALPHKLHSPGDDIRSVPLRERQLPQTFQRLS